MDARVKRDPVASIWWRGLRAIQEIQKPFARRELSRYDARLPHTRYILRAISVVRLLEKFKPRRIVELGAGESTAWFAAYAAKHSAIRVTSINQTNWSFSDRPVPAWWRPAYLQESTATARHIGNIEFIEARAVKEPTGWRYDIELPPDTDFLFVDGPYHPIEEPGMDAAILLMRGIRPKVICVDGRLTDVDAIKQVVHGYAFKPLFRYSFERRDYLSSLALNEHSIFIRKD